MRKARVHLTRELLADLLGLHAGARVLDVRTGDPDTPITVWVESYRLDDVAEGHESPVVNLRPLRES